MAFGGLTESIPYVLEEDRDLPKENQTRFYIRQRSAKEVNKLAARIANRGTNRRGKPKPMSAEEIDQINSAEWSLVVTKVENFFVSTDADKEVLGHFSLGEKSETVNGVVSGNPLQFYVLDGVGDAEGLDLIRLMLTTAQIAEIFEASEKIGALTEIEKKA